VFRRRPQVPLDPANPPRIAPQCEAPSSEPEDAETTTAADRLARIAARFGLSPWEDGAEAGAGLALADALYQCDPFWTTPRPGELQRGVHLLCGGRAPGALAGMRLWPVLGQSASGPALVLADIRHRVHVVVDVAQTGSGVPVRPGWVPASVVAPAPHMPGSHPLWRHWQIELADHAPHEPVAACADHTHLARPNAQGRFLTGIPQHDAWMMSRSWLPDDLVLPSVTDVHWVVFGSSSRSLRERDPLIRSRWDVVSFADFAELLAAGYEQDATLPPAVATVVRMLLPTR
jgi:hypothetical protein